MNYVVLLSSGLDSTVNLFEAHLKGRVELALTFNYGQRAAPSEIRSAQNLTRYLGIPHQVVDLSFFKQFGTSSLIDSSLSIPTGADVKIDDLSTSKKTARSVWVPNRNGIFLNIAAGYAEALQAQAVVPGFNLEEATTFADNSTDFMKSLDQSFSYSTSNRVKVVCYTDRLTKTEIVKRGIELNVPFSMIWPCYFDGETWCGQCESCQRSLRALRAQGVHI